MSWADLGRWLREIAASLADLLWAALALTLDAAAGIGPLAAGLWAIGYLAMLLAAAILMQRQLVARIAAQPDTRVPWLRQEVWFFLPAWLVLPFVALGRALRALWKLLTRLGRKGKTGAEASPQAAQPPFAAASLGPSFLLGGAATAALFLLALLAGQVIAWRQGLPPGTPPWQSLLLGGRPELAAYLPLERRAPWLAALLLVLLWGTVWWWCSRLARLVFWRHLGRSVLDSLDDPQVLPLWREPAEARRLIAAARPYRQWSGTLLVSAVPLAGMAWLALGAVPHRVGPVEMAVAAVLGLAWGTHLVLRGAERLPAEAAEAPPAAPPPGAGWPEVREDLDRRLQLPTPLPTRPPRPLPVLAAGEDLATDPLLSPLLAELLPATPDGRRGLTPMQRRELDRLARLGHVFTRPPAAPGELRLGSGDADESEGVRERNRVVLAPEGSGKSTLAILAAANHALVHTRATLLVLRDEAAAGALYERFVARVDRSTLRWNLRVRRIGDDLAGDLAQGIVPDVLVTSLHQLVVGLLDQLDLHARLLRNVGLIVVDDAESYAGGAEAHAQLAFRRLTMACRKLLGVDQLGDRAAPLVLALATDSMHQTAAWIGGLCGIDSEVERYGAAAAQDDDRGSAPPPRQQEVYRLADFRTATGERLDVAELVESCERLGVAWCYRRAADGERHLGRAALLLKDEPSWAVDDPLDAAVVLIEGAWSETQREIDRLAMAGCRFPHGPVALLTLADPDHEMAFTQWDDKLSLAAELATLPRPALRPPSGRTVASHLAADLTQSWTEVADLLRTFGNGIAGALSELAREGLLVAERRIDVARQQHRYENKVFVRALASAVAAGGEEEGEGAPLPPKVSQVALACESMVEVVDRTDLARLAVVDADSAALAYYPGRVFADARGRWVVVHRASDEAEGGGGRRRGVPAGAIIAEPLLADDVSSPRRRIEVEVLETGSGSGPGAKPAAAAPLDPTGHAFYGPDPLLIGERPLEVGLAKVAVTTRHHATYLLGPVFGEVRQRRLFDTETRERLGAARLETVAVSLHPNPEGAGGPDLRFAEARLLAALFRAVLPSMLRGAGEAMEVALQVDDERPAPDRPLAPLEGFYLFDVHHLGNGSARALHRDGLELLLRLARLMLERVLYHDRLRALHDQWPEELTGAAAEAGEAATADAARARRERDERLRHGLLAWLDSRLRPEGSAAVLSGLVGRYGSDVEEGEGDRIDVGRCWWTADGGVTDLVWAKHRWRVDGTVEAMVDVAFDRRTAEEARRLDLASPQLEPGRRVHREHLADARFALPDGTVWGVPRGVWRVEGEGDLHSSQPGAGDESLAAFHETAAALAWTAWPRLGPLAERLARLRRAGEPEDGEVPDAGGAEGRHLLARRLGSFAAGIPGLRAAHGAEGLPPLRPLEEVLLLRRGTTASKGLLLATLLARSGVRTGLFVSLAEGRVLAAAALPEPLATTTATVTVHRDEEGRFSKAEESAGRPEVHQRGRRAAQEVLAHLEAWSESVGLDRPPVLWADLPVDHDAGSPFDVYVPLDTAAPAPPGRTHMAAPESWLFLPLVSVWHAHAPPEDAAEAAPPAPEALAADEPLEAPYGDESGERETP